MVWDSLSQDAAYRPTKTTDQLAARLKRLLEEPIPPNDWLTNMSEIDFWNDVLKRRDNKWTMTAWSRAIVRAENLTPGSDQPVMEDDRISHYRAMRDEIRAAKPRKKPNKLKQ